MTEPGKRTRKKQLAGAELIAQDMEAARLRVVERLTYQQIADALGFKEDTGARDAVLRHLHKEQHTSVDQLQAEILAELAEVRGLLLDNIRKGKTYDVDRLVRVIERVARMVPGLDAPVQVEVTQTVTEIRHEAEELVGKFRKADLHVVAS